VPRLGTSINSPTRVRPSLGGRILALQQEAGLFFDECTKLQGLDATSVVDCMGKADRRLTMLRHGVTLVRTEAKIIARAESLLAAGKAAR